MRESLEALREQLVYERRYHATYIPPNKEVLEERDDWISALDQALAQESLLVEMREALEGLIQATELADNPGDMGVSSDAVQMKLARAALAKAKALNAQPIKPEPDINPVLDIHAALKEALAKAKSLDAQPIKL